MELVNRESAAELLQAQAHVWNHTFNFINSMALKCAVQLGIPDIIHSHGQPMSLSDLVSALPIHPTKTPHVARLMRILVHSGFFSMQKIGADRLTQGYELTQACRLLLKSNPMSATPLLLAVLDPILIKPWHDLSTWFKNNDHTAFSVAHGKSMWELTRIEPRFNLLFNEAMASDSSLVSNVVIRKCKGVFEGLKSLVDVGGGTGTMAKTIAEEFPHLDCTVFDLPQVVSELQGSKNLKFLGGDIFVAVPPADAIMLKWILHDWSDEDCVKILKQCKEAITGNSNGGKVIIIEMVMGSQEYRDDESIETQMFFDMQMMACVDGRERNETEWAKLFFDAGFRNYKINPILGLRALVEVYP